MNKLFSLIAHLCVPQFFNSEFCNPDVKPFLLHTTKSFPLVSFTTSYIELFQYTFSLLSSKKFIVLRISEFVIFFIFVIMVQIYNLLFIHTIIYTIIYKVINNNKKGAVTCSRLPLLFGTKI